MKHTTQVQPKPSRFAPASLILTGLMLLATLALVTLASGAAPLNAQNLQQRAILGFIYNVESYGGGLTVITVQDQNGGQLQLEAKDELTIVNIPGQANSLAQDLQVGTTLAALALERVGVINVNTATDLQLQSLPQVGPARSQAIVNYRTSNGYFDSVNDLLQVSGINQSILDTIRGQIVVNDWLLAQQIMSKPGQAVLHFHVTGVVVRLTPSEISILDAEGNLITLALTLGGASGISPGTPVTVAINYDPKLGTYTAVDIDRVEDAVTRLISALTMAEQARDAENIANLRLRLVDAVGRVSAALKQAVDRAPVVRQAVQSYIGELQTLLRALDLYGPVVTVTGVVDLVDATGGFLGITGKDDLPIDLRVVPETVIRDGNVDIALNQELFGRRVRVTYDPSPESLRTHRIDLIRDTGLPQHIIEQLAASASQGETEGLVVEVNQRANPNYIVVELDDGSRLPLQVVPGAGYETGLGSFHRSRVAVRYDPYNLDLLYIQESRPTAGETPIAGVIRDLDLKESREIDIAVAGGTVLTVTWVANSQVARDSIPINPSDISIGDVVRPTSSYVAPDVTFLTIRQLDLVSPVASIAGPILGVDAQAGRITVLPDDGQLVTILVDGFTEVIRNEESDILESVRPGERLASGSLYNPLTSRASRIVVEPAKVARITGTVTDVDRQKFIITVTPDGTNNQLVLLVPNKPKIVTVNGDPGASFLDLRVNDRVGNLLYRYDDQVVVELIVSSR